MTFLCKFISKKNYFPKTEIDKYNVYYAVIPFIKLCKLCALCPYGIRNNNGEIKLKFSMKSLLYSIVLFIAYIVGFINGVHLLRNQPISTPTIITHFSGWAQIYSLFTITAIGILCSWLTTNKAIKLIDQIQLVDNLIAKKLAVVTPYNRYRKVLCFQIGGLSVVPICLSMVNCIILNERALQLTGQKACFWFICFGPILVITLKEFQFYNLMLLIRTKLKITNSQLSLLDGRRFTKVESINSIDSEKEVLVKLESREEFLSEKLKDIAEINVEINTATKITLEVFAGHLFLITTTALGAITVQIYNLYAFSIGYLHMDVFAMFATVAWILLQIGVVLLNVTVCSIVSDEMSNTGPILHNIQSLSENRQVFQTAQMFSLQILHRNVSFTAAGFFNLDYKLITSIVAAVTTYLVIIIQFHIANTQNADKAGLNVKPNATLMP